MGGRLEEPKRWTRELRDGLEIKTQNLGTEGRQVISENLRDASEKSATENHKGVCLCKGGGEREGEERERARAHLKCGSFLPF